MTNTQATGSFPKTPRKGSSAADGLRKDGGRRAKAACGGVHSAAGRARQAGGRKPTTPAARKAKAERVRTLARWRRAGTAACTLILGAGAVVGALLFARPAISEVERRATAAFPEPSVASVCDGSFFQDVALWYSDTYPLREQLVGANRVLERAHGVTSDVQMFGGAKQADELPPLERAEDDASEESADDPQETPEDRRERRRRERGTVEVPAAEVMAEAIQNQVLDGLYIKGDAAYNIYYFSQTNVETYADAMNTAADELAGQAQVYCVLGPNASGILLSDQEVKDLGGTNQRDAIEYLYSLLDPAVYSVDTVSELLAHADEYIYYRTDHHWTALGAYYAYVAFCAEKGIEPESLDELEYCDLGDFLGSFYSETGSEAMAAHPDTCEAWIPADTNRMTLYDTDGSATEYDVITDTSNWSITGKTMCFIMGDQPLERIDNPTLSDGSSCLVVKDSFGDFFVPWLVDHYQTVWVADFRYFEGNIADFVRQHDVGDLIFMNNITLAGGSAAGPAILGRL